MDHNYDLRWSRGHILIYKDGKFIASADTMYEARKIIEEEESNETD